MVKYRGEREFRVLVMFVAINRKIKRKSIKLSIEYKRLI